MNMESPGTGFCGPYQAWHLRFVGVQSIKNFNVQRADSLAL